MLDLQKIKEEITCIAVNSYTEYLEALCYGINCNIEELKSEAEENTKLMSLACFLITNPECFTDGKVLCKIQDKIFKLKSTYNCSSDVCKDNNIISCNTSISIVEEPVINCELINIKVIK